MKLKKRFPVDTMDILSWLTVLEPRKAIEAKRSSEDFSLYGADKLQKLVAQIRVCNAEASHSFQ